MGSVEPKRRDSRPPAECSVEGCEKPRHARGWCQGHYVRWKAIGEPGPAALNVVRYNGAACCVEGCEEVATSLGWCKLHYGRAARTGQPGEAEPWRALRNRGESCILEGCERPRRSKGWCEMHLAAEDPRRSGLSRCLKYLGPNASRLTELKGGLSRSHRRRLAKCRSNHPSLPPCIALP